MDGREAQTYAVGSQHDDENDDDEDEDDAEVGRTICPLTYYCWSAIDEEPRQVYFGVDWEENDRFCTNAMRTKKYTPLTFLPLNLYEQLQKFSNMYYVLLSFAMWCGKNTDWFISPLQPSSTLSVVLSMMAVSAFVSILDDCRRGTADHQTNHQKATIHTMDEKYKTVSWADVQVGDMVFLSCDEHVPADLVCLAASGDDGTCFVSTASLDGETNLKVKSAAASAQALLTSSRRDPQELFAALHSIDGRIWAEAPRDDIYGFNGKLDLNGREQSLGADNLILRSTVLRNTDWLIGVVVYTGKETRSGMNQAPARLKQSNIERIINRTMLVIVGTQIILSLISSVASCRFRDTVNSYWYIFPEGGGEDISWPCVPGYFVTFFILYSNMLPPSLYASLEIVNWAQSYFIKNDLKMFDKKEGIPALCRSSNLCQELGQVSYVFSDKTGTLTQNIMDMKQLSIDGKKYGEMKEEKGFFGAEEIHKDISNNQGKAAKINAFFETLQVCHTVQIRENEAGVQKLEAESPDEGALVEGVSELGWKFVARERKELQVRFPQEQEPRVYTILALNAFTSARKRNSVIARTQKGEHYLFCKGADNIMLERAEKGDRASLIQDLEDFALVGLRTLVIGRRKLQDAEVSAWLSEFEKAQVATSDRVEKLEACAERIERDLEILGATAIEDKLQEDCAATIVGIRKAGIKFWVLTGDKLETARNIGLSTEVLNHNMDILILDQADEELDQALWDYDERSSEQQESGVVVALMVTGKALQDILDDDTLERSALFIEIAMRCSVVIACRVSPKQKGQIVTLMREKTNSVTLAVGDGANDVEMINAAQVGIGIYGREGRQAVNASDFAIAKFKFLKPLLVVHGRWNYRRACKLILYTFWKNTVFVLCMFFYAFVSALSGTPIFSDMLWNGYNAFLFCPIIFVAIFDRDLERWQAETYTFLYSSGRKGLDLNVAMVSQTVVSAFIHCILLLFIFMLAVPALEVHDSGGYYAFGTIVYSGLLVSTSYRVAFVTTTWTWWNVGSILFTFFLYVLFLVVYGSMRDYDPAFYEVPNQFSKLKMFWISIATLPLAAYVIDVVVAYFYHEIRPNKLQLILEEALKNEEADFEQYHFFDTEEELSSRPSQKSSNGYVSVPNLFRLNPGKLLRIFRSGSEEQETGDTDFDYPEGTASWGQGSLERSGGVKSFRAQPSENDDGEQAAPFQHPSETRFAQQALPSIQISMRPRMVIVGLILSAAFFLGLGLRLFFGSKASEFAIVQYAGDVRQHGYVQDDEYVYHRCEANTSQPNACELNITIPRSMDGPLEVNYMLDPFYQNHERYYQSIPYGELGGDASTTPSMSECPSGTRTDPTGKRVYPCGLPAVSFFNDTLEIFGRTIKDRGLAWTADVERFDNPPSFPNDTNVSWLTDRYPRLFDREGKDAGLKSERFLTWMRPSALEILIKPYGTIQDGLPAGEYRMRINASFPTDQFGVKKWFFLAKVESSSFAYRGNWLFGLSLLGLGGFCTIAAAVILSMEVCCRRKPGHYYHQGCDGFRQDQVSSDDDGNGFHVDDGADGLE